MLSHRGVTVFRGEAELRDVHDVHVAPAGGEAQVMRSFKAGVEEPVGSELTIKAKILCWRPDRDRYHCRATRFQVR